MYSKEKPSELEVRKFVNLHRGVIYGMILGDGTIFRGGHKSFMTIRQCANQKEYLFHKHMLLKPMASGDPSFYVEKGDYVMWGFGTTRSTEWQRIWSTFHQDSPVEIRTLSNGKTIRYHRKVVTKHILKELDDHGVAIWFMDDGCLGVWYNKARRHKAKRFVLSTDGFTLEENELIRSWFLERYGVVAQIGHNNYTLKNGTKKRSCRIRISWTEYQKLIPRIERYIIPSMRYKIEPPQDKGVPTTCGNKTHSDLAGDRESQPEMVDRPVESRVSTNELQVVGKATDGKTFLGSGTN